MTRPSASIRRTSLAPSTTWLLVSTRPSGAITTPEPTPPVRPLAAARFDPHHGRADAVGDGDHGMGIGVEDFGVGRGRCRRQAVVLDIGRRSKIEHGNSGVLRDEPGCRYWCVKMEVPASGAV